MGSAILLFSRSCHRPYRNIYHGLLERVLLVYYQVYYQLMQTSPFSVQLLRSQLPHDGLSVDPLLGVDCSPELYCHYNSQLYSYEQYSVHLLRISCSSGRHFPDLSWTVVDLLCFSELDPLPADTLSSCCYCSDKHQSPCSGYLSNPPSLSSGPSEPFCLLFCILSLLLLYTASVFLKFKYSLGI